jgi:hypothetical protein
MHIAAGTIFALGCFSYLICLLGALWLYRTHRWKIVRYILALLVFLPALVVMYTGLVLLGTSMAGGYHTGDSVSDPSGLVTVIGIGVCVLGMFIALIAVRLVTRSLMPQKKEGA